MPYKEMGYEYLKKEKLKEARVPFGPKEVVKSVDKTFPTPKVNPIKDLKMKKV